MFSRLPLVKEPEPGQLEVPDGDGRMIESEGRERQQPAWPRVRQLSAGSWPNIAREYGIIVLFVVLFAILSAVAPNFLSTRNLLNILSNNATVGIISLGMTLVIIAGGFDLSVGAVFALSGVAAAWLAIHLGTPLGLSLGMLI